MAAGVSLVSDLPNSITSAAGNTTSSSSVGHSREISTNMVPVRVRVPTAKYTKMGETLRHVIPGHMQCSMACGGRACKYENPSRWSDEEQAIKGLYSSWITENLLAMARPSTEIIEKYNVIQQFLGCDVKTVINLQRPGEHASCGFPLEPESGFTYRPEVFMEAGIYFYNFGWKDYGVASLTTILDMVKVMSFAIQEGKLAIHCHAGLGRTGVLLACYLVFTSRMSADQAILFVRAKRPNSIQTRGQLLCVREFAQFLAPLRNVFPRAEPKAHAVTLAQYLTRQRHLLHGYEARQMKNVPKVVHLSCRLLLDVAENRRTPENEAPEIPDLTAEVEKTVSQQALQQLGKEMRGKGILETSPRASESAPVADERLPSELDDPKASGRQEFELLWKALSSDRPTVKRRLVLRPALSFSDTALHLLQSDRRSFSTEPSRQISNSNLLSERCMSQNRLTVESLDPQSSRLLLTPESCDESLKSGSLAGSSVSLDAAPGEEREQEGVLQRSPALRKRVPLKETKRSKSLGFSGNSDALLSTWQWQVEEDGSGETRELKPSDRKLFGHRGTGGNIVVADEVFGVPFGSAQTELTLEDRRLLVAKALAMDVDEEDLRNAVLKWQTELNSREGAWERLCWERDPLLLSSLMWSWLEQLKEPVITKADLEAMMENSSNPQHALNAMQKGHRQTLLCILDCVAHLMQLPDEVESAVLRRTIKAFTRVNADSENGYLIYKALRGILHPVLNDLRRKAMEELDSTCHCA